MTRVLKSAGVLAVLVAVALLVAHTGVSAQAPITSHPTPAPKRRRSDSPKKTIAAHPTMIGSRRRRQTGSGPRIRAAA